MTNKKPKIRSKKFNRVEAVRRNNERILKGFAVAYFANDLATKQDIILVNLKGEKMPVTRTMSDAITKHRYKWEVYLCAGCLNSKGLKELKLETVASKEPYLQSELVEFLNKRHQAFFAGLREKNVRIEWGGWIARASGRELEAEEVYNLFENIGAWSSDGI